MTQPERLAPPGYRLGPSTSEIGCLLIHGFSGGPEDLRYLAQRLEQRRWAVAVPALAGHRPIEEGSKPPAAWADDWERETVEALEELAEDCRRVYVAGLSMGALLTLRLASQQASKIQSIVLLSTPLKVSSQRMRLPMRLAGALLPGRKVKFKEESDIRQSPEPSVRTRTHMPLGALAGFFLLQERADEVLEKISTPVLAVHSKQDHTAPFSNLSRLQSRVRPDLFQSVVLTESYHVVSNDVEREQVAEEVVAHIDQRESL